MIGTNDDVDDVLLVLFTSFLPLSPGRFGNAVCMWL